MQSRILSRRLLAVTLAGGLTLTGGLAAAGVLPGAPADPTLVVEDPSDVLDDSSTTAVADDQNDPEGDNPEDDITEVVDGDADDDADDADDAGDTTDDDADDDTTVDDDGTGDGLDADTPKVRRDGDKVPASAVVERAPARQAAPRDRDARLAAWLDGCQERAEARADRFDEQGKAKQAERARGFGARCEERLEKWLRRLEWRSTREQARQEWRAEWDRWSAEWRQEWQQWQAEWQQELADWKVEWRQRWAQWWESRQPPAPTARPAPVQETSAPDDDDRQDRGRALRRSGHAGPRDEGKGAGR